VSGFENVGDTQVTHIRLGDTHQRGRTTLTKDLRAIVDGHLHYVERCL